MIRMDRLVLWDIDRTLLYVGEIDRDVYGGVFEDLVGRRASQFPAKGTGRTLPLATREFFVLNGVSEADADELVPQALAMIPHRFSGCLARLRSEGYVYPGAMEALHAVAELPGTVATVLTGNLQANAVLKLAAFGMDRMLDVSVGGFSSDDPHRPALVAIAQKRAGELYGGDFRRANTVIVGDSLEDVATGSQGGAAVLGVASGVTSADELRTAGADLVIESLVDVAAVTAGILSLTGP